MCAEVVELRSAIQRKERAKKAGKAGGKNRSKDLSLEAETTPKLKDESKTRTRAAVAKEYKVPENKLRDMAKIKKVTPEVFDEIKDGKTSVRAANKEIKKREAAAQPQPKDKYPHSDQFRNLLKHIDDKVTAMQRRHDTVAEMVADEKWDKTKTQDIAERLHSTIEVLIQYDEKFRRVLAD